MNMKETIYLKRNQKEATIEYLTTEQLDEALALRNEIRSKVAIQEWYAKVTLEEYAQELSRGFALVCLVEGKIVAVCLCVLEDTEYAHEIYEDKDIQLKCADYSDTYVHEDYRGNGLQHLLEEKMEQICLEHGKTILLGTVHPENQYSYNNFIRSGYKKIVRLRMYGGLDRYMMEKRL